MNRIIILGCGYIGTNLANYISQSFHEDVYVYGIENEYTSYLVDEVHFIDKYIEQIDDDDKDIFLDSIVVDAVGNINATNGSNNSSGIFINNCANNINLIEKLHKLKIKKFIFLSSGGTVYSDSVEPHIETEALNPKSIYALEKVTIEEYLKIYGNENKEFPFLILRLSNPYGGIISKNKKQGIIDVAITKIKNDEAMDFYGELSNVRDYIHIEDVAYYIYFLSISDIKNDIFNVGSGVGSSLEELFQIIEQIAGKKIDLNVRASNTINIKSNVLNVNKLNSVVKLDKLISLKEGIERYFK